MGPTVMGEVYLWISLGGIFWGGGISLEMQGREGGKLEGWCSTSGLWERGRNELVLQGRAAVGLLMLAVLHRITE